MRPWKILLVEDNRNILQMNKELFELEGYEVLTAQTVAEAQKAFKAGNPDIIVLDIMLPDGSGLDFCRNLRQSHTTPVLFLTCMDEKSQVLDGFEAGGDDYLVKPYILDELIARCAALLRRLERRMLDSLSTITIGNITIDPATQRALLDGEDVFLKQKEFALLMMLIRSDGKGLLPEELYREIWGQQANDDVRTVRVHISNIRKKLRLSEKTPISIDFVFKHGYQLKVQNPH